jgi:hypothetical protein
MVDWIKYAKEGTPGGRAVRFSHCDGSGRDAVAHNSPRAYTAYCYACGWKAFRSKEYSLLHQAEVGEALGRVQPAAIDTLIPELYDAIAGYTLKYGMLPEEAGISGVYRDRMIVECGDVQKGRLLPFASPSGAKWLTYVDGLATVGTGDHAVIVEDLLSMYKVHKAMPELSVVALLGKTLKPHHKIYLGRKSIVTWLLDGDEAGVEGVTRGYRELSVWSNSQRIVYPPLGLDPKDISLRDIRRCLKC